MKYFGKILEKYNHTKELKKKQLSEFKIDKKLIGKTNK
jgi:hypothetical protein